MTTKRGLQIHTLEQQAHEAANALYQALTADRRLWLDATQTKLVEDGDPEAAFQLAAPGYRITAAEAKRLDLHTHEGRIIQGPVPEAEAKDPATELADRTARYVKDGEKAGLTGEALEKAVQGRLKVDELVAGGMPKKEAKDLVFGKESKARAPGENK